MPLQRLFELRAFIASKWHDFFGQDVMRHAWVTVQIWNCLQETFFDELKIEQYAENRLEHHNK